MADDRILERERHQIELIRQLDYEELQVEEVDDLDDSSDDGRDATGAEASNQLTFDTCLASLHTYLGDVEDTHHRMAFLEGGAILTLPLFYLEGVVLFPEATLPLRVIQPNFIGAVERALSQIDALYTIGVVPVYRAPDNRRIRLATTGTTAEIRQYRRLEDGSLNVVTRGQQRFRLRRRWIDVEGVPCGEVQIIQEDLPLRTSRDAFESLGSARNLLIQSFSHTLPPNSASLGYVNGDNDSDATSEESFESELSPTERRIHQSVIDPASGYDMMDESTSSDNDKSALESDIRSRRPHLNDSNSMGNWKQSEKVGLGIGKSSKLGRESHRGEGSKMCRWNELSQFRRTSRAFLPHWVYRMYDSYCLAQRAAVNYQSLNLQDELLEIDGVSYRLRREIELLESFDIVRCKTCKTAIARRSDMLVMSSEGPLGAYVNPHGCVHEILTLNKTNDVALKGRAKTEYSWFPGYAWTIASCSICKTHMGWLFTATKRKLKPKLFWGICSSQVAEGTC